MTKNKCPHPDCELQKPLERYSCPAHWYSLPARVRSMIWDAYREHGALSPQWLAAHEKALAFWNQKSKTA